MMAPLVQEAFMIPRQVVEPSHPGALLDIVRKHTGGEPAARQVLEQLRALGTDAGIDDYQVTRESAPTEALGEQSPSWRVEAIRPQQQ